MLSLRNKLLFCFLFATVSGHCQYVAEFLPKEEPGFKYLFFGLSVPLRHHFDQEARVQHNRMLPDGINTKFGAGVHLDRWLGAGLHTGTEWRISDRLVSVPVYFNLRIAPYINEDTRFYVQPGYGYAWALGRGDLSGDYKKISVGLEGDDGVSVYAEFSQYGFSTDSSGKMNALSVGFGLFIF